MKEWIEHLAVYEPGKPIEEVARELGFEDLSEIVKVASNENEWGPSPKAIEAMKDVAADMHRYPDGGCFYLRKQLAAKLDVKPDQLLFGNGSNELIVLLAHLYLEPGTSMVMAEQAFAVYALATHLYQADLIRVPMQDFTHDLEAMQAAIRPDTRLMAWVNPNNPTGTAVDPHALIEAARAVPPHVLVIIDEAYFEVMPAAVRGDSLALIREGCENVIVLRTFSKGYGLAGLRIGYGVANEKLISRLNRVRQPFNVNAMAQAGALAALDDEEHLQQTARLTQAGCRQLTEGLQKMGIPVVPSAANFVLAKTGAGREWFHALQQAKIIVRPMDGYGLPDYIRITVGTEKQNETALRAVARIQNQFK
tara:strand:- start:2122 stop:3216 length:1095 start_codon:yes stop_codon:yes gene_type:complete